MNNLLVVGASGVIGGALVEHAAGLANWRVYGLSRRAPDVDHADKVIHLPLDLADARACADALHPLKTSLTHVVYAAVAEKPGLVAGWSDAALMQQNLQMLRNVLEPLKGSKSLRHITIMQGTKAYGVHLHPATLPLVEDAPRDDHANFYWLQEDFLRAMSAAEGWSWTILRPQIVLGGAHGVVMNPIPVIGAYAAICREEGVACAFPGAHVALWEATDARLIAQACVWAADAKEARNQIFNITNGDLWVPGHQWPDICAMLKVAPGPAAPTNFVEFVESKSHVWDKIVRRENLRPISLKSLVGESHHYLNLLLCNGQSAAPWPPALVSTIKIRQAGFGACFDTRESMRYWFDWLARRRILPRV
jgi:nucleoside-diphosphate-sugar epimerase